jgi:hypothetical protein
MGDVINSYKDELAKAFSDANARMDAVGNDTFSDFNNVQAENSEIDEKWSDKYKKSIDCNNPKGFSQKAHCQGKKKTENKEATGSGSAGGYAQPLFGNIEKEDTTESDDAIQEDLKRWFKEKWVDVSKKVDGKHPPCGRKDANGKSYPKCRPSKKVSDETPKIASSYDKDEKKKMTQQKRRAEKKDPKIGKGNEPTMTHFDGGKKHKTETKEATGSSSSGSYVTPAAWAKSTKKKHWRGASKPLIPGGKFVQVKKRCKTFPYCNQGDIKSLKIWENEMVKGVIEKISTEHNINENIIKRVIIQEIINSKNK